MADSVGSGFPTSGINKGHTFYDLDEQSLWMYLGGIPRLSSSWILISGRLSVQPDTSLWGAAQAGAQWFLTSDLQFYGWNGSSIVLVSNGSSNPSLYEYNSVKIQEDFLSGALTDQHVGDLGWSAFNGISTEIASVGGRIGIIRRDTTAVSGTQTSTALLAQSQVPILTSFDHTLRWDVRLNTNDINTKVRIGILTTYTASTPTDGMYFEKLDADTNWFAVVRIGNVDISHVDTGVAVNTFFNSFSYVRNSLGVQFSINNTAVGGVVAATSNGLDPDVSIMNSAGASKTLDIDYFELVVTGLSRSINI